MYSTLSFHESAGEEPAKSAVVRRSEHPPLFVTASAAACNQDLFVMGEAHRESALFVGYFAMATVFYFHLKAPVYNCRPI